MPKPGRSEKPKLRFEKIVLVAPVPELNRKNKLPPRGRRRADSLLQTPSALADLSKEVPDAKTGKLEDRYLTTSS